MFYRSAPCLGVKICPENDCTYIAPIRERRACPKHSKCKLIRTEGCPVEFVYLFPQKFHEDHRRWIGGVIRTEKRLSSNLHNHGLHGSIKISQCVKDQISSAVLSNPTLTPSDIAIGKGVGFIPSAMDTASSHLGKVARQINTVKSNTGTATKDWSPTSFEKCADELDDTDFQKSGDSIEKKQKYSKLGRPYLISTGMENGINFIFCMTPFMTQIAEEADFIETDITYDHMIGYKFLFNAVAFNHQSMEWMVIARLWLDRQDAAAYALGFRKLFEQCKQADTNFSIGKTLIGIVTDWSDSEIKGLKNVVGEETASELLKGCKVHWLRSCQRVADRIASSEDKQLECEVFMKIAAKIQVLQSAVNIVACFETLCGVRTATQLMENIPGVCTPGEASYIDKNSNWSKAKSWAKWWSRSTHLKMLCKALSEMSPEAWDKCPSTTNAVERKNRDCSSPTPQHPKLAMMQAYKLDKVAYYKHMAAEEGTSISYRSKTDEARASNAAARCRERKRKVPQDKQADFGPPDKKTHFSNSATESSSARKRKCGIQHTTMSHIKTKPKAIEVDNCVVKILINPHPEVMGKRVRAKYELTDVGHSEWFEGVITTYNCLTGKYGVYFPCDNKTEEFSLDDEDLEFIA